MTIGVDIKMIVRVELITANSGMTGKGEFP
jgi:hypothetical protein